MMALSRMLLVLGMALISGTSAAADGPTEPLNPLLGSWQVTTLVMPDSTTEKPKDMFVSISADGLIAVTVGTLGTTKSHFTILRHSRHTLSMRVETEGKVVDATVDLADGGATMVTDGTTMLLRRLSPDEVAKQAKGTPGASAPDDKALLDASDKALAGVVDAEAWTLLEVRPNLLQDADAWRLNLLAEHPPDDSHERRPQIVVTVPHALGRRKFDEGFNITFYLPPGANHVCIQGYVDVKSISDTEVVCSLNAWDGEANHLNGTFSFDPRTIPSP